MGSSEIDVAEIVRQTFVADVDHHASIPSTNDRAAELGRANLDGKPPQLPLLVLADEQTRGRGRGSHRWWTGHGSLAMSLLVDPEWESSEKGPSLLVALATAVAVVDTIAPLVPYAVGIHWPNDVMADDRKVAGILVEVLPNRRHVLGIGLNTNNTMADAPAELHAIATTIRDLAGGPIDATAVLITLLTQIESRLGDLSNSPDSLATRANQLCLQHGETLTLRQNDETTTGRCLGISPEGALLLETPEGARTFYSGTLEKH